MSDTIEGAERKIPVQRLLEDQESERDCRAWRSSVCADGSAL